MTQAEEFSWLLNLLKNAGATPHVIVIGSWAEYLYAKCNVLENYQANLRTLDTDFLIKNMRLPREKINLLSVLSDAGCTIEHSMITDAVRIYTPGLLEVEFLIAQKGAATENWLDTNLGIKAPALQHLSILRDNTITVNYMGLDISIPEPEAYVLHKMAINHSRKKPEKKEKDAESVINILPHLNSERLKSLYNVMTKKEKRHIKDFIDERNLNADFL